MNNRDDNVFHLIIVIVGKKHCCKNPDEVTSQNI